MATRVAGTIQRVPIITASSGAVIVKGVAGFKIRVLAWLLSASANVQAQFQSGSGSPTADLTGHIYLAANAPASAGYCEVGWFDGATGDDLTLNLSASTPVGGGLVYVLVPAK